MLGVCDAELGRNEEAVRILEPVFRSPPDAQRGRLAGLELQRPYKLLGEHAKADAVAEEMIRRYPDDPEILYDAAGLYTDRIYELLKRLVDVAPGSVWIHLAFAQSHESAKRYDAAIADYRNALRQNGQLRGVHFNLGRDLLLSGDSEQHRREALEEFNQELALNPQSANTEYEIGEVYRRQGKLEPAREHFSTALEYSADFEDAQIGLARVLMGLNRPQEALDHLTVAVRLNARNEVSHFLLSKVYRSLGDTSRQQKEIALFQQYRAHSGDSMLELPPQATTPQITRQSLDSEASSLP